MSSWYSAPMALPADENIIGRPMTQNHQALPSESRRLSTISRDCERPRSRIAKSRTAACSALAALWLGALLAFSASAVSITEPATIFYGKILDLSSPHGSLVTTGALTWVVHRADGLNQVLRAKIQPLNGGLYSYSLNVPHEALALGLDSSPNGVPLRS